MKTLIIQHELSCPAGSTIDWLTQNQISFDLCMADSLLQKTIDPAEFSALIVLGGGMNVDEESQYPWLRLEKKLIESFVSSRKRTLGLCLGGQLLAEVLGAKVSKAPHWETGFHEIHLENLPAPLLQSYRTFQWHGYQFETPLNAKKIASSKACPNQGFIYEGIALGTQFHPEADEQFVRSCLEDRLPQGPYCQDTNEILRQMRVLPSMKDWYFRLLDFHFLNR